MVTVDHDVELWTQGVYVRVDGRLVARLNPDMSWTVWASASPRATHRSLRRPARVIALLGNGAEIAEALNDATRIMRAAWARATDDEQAETGPRPRGPLSGLK